jgi:hypothetical protein
MFAAWFRRRAWMLHKGISTLLGDKQLAARMYEHPLIQGLSSPPGIVSRVPMLRGLVGRGPSYMPSRTFAIALIDIVQNGEDRHLPSDSGRSVDRVLAVLLKEAGNDPVRFRANIETWFNDSMERVSGWYKRRTQVLLLLWAAAVTIATNADTVVIAKALWRDPALRQTLVARAEEYVAQQPQPGAAPATQPVDGAPPPPALPPDQQAEADFIDASAQYDAALADLAELQLPIGWDDPASPAAGETSLRLVTDAATDDWPGTIWEPGGLARWLRAVDQHAVGWLLTILAVSMGAPFWFDTLNRIMSVRTTGKAPDETQKPRKQIPEPREPDEMAMA